MNKHLTDKKISRIWAKLSTVLKSTIFVLEKLYLHQKNQNGHVRWGGDGQKWHLINKFRDIVDYIIFAREIDRVD